MWVCFSCCSARDRFDNTGQKCQAQEHLLEPEIFRLVLSTYYRYLQMSRHYLQTSCITSCSIFRCLYCIQFRANYSETVNVQQISCKFSCIYRLRVYNVSISAKIIITSTNFILPVI